MRRTSQTTQGKRKVVKHLPAGVLGVCGNRVFAGENVGPNKTRHLSFALLGDFAFALVPIRNSLYATQTFG